ncbi:hypothetical protein HanRHA438_Chr06g0251951 [Helianthus annuus]|nr:hypothetical protein HanRHA438_Chr06g0251951 [Helianthus annuus]
MGCVYGRCVTENEATETSTIDASVQANKKSTRVINLRHFFYFSTTIFKRV